jgi:hypothetical protein
MLFDFGLFLNSLNEFETALGKLDRDRPFTDRREVGVNIQSRLFSLALNLFSQLIAPAVVSAIGITGQQVLHAPVTLALGVDRGGCHCICSYRPG